jgi:hypothetical protein
MHEIVPQLVCVNAAITSASKELLFSRVARGEVEWLATVCVSFSRNLSGSDCRQMRALSRKFPVPPRKRSLNKENVRILPRRSSRRMS